MPTIGDLFVSSIKNYLVTLFGFVIIGVFIAPTYAVAGLVTLLASPSISRCASRARLSVLSWLRIQSRAALLFFTRNLKGK